MSFACGSRAGALEERLVEEADDPLLVLLGALADRGGVAHVGKLPVLERLFRYLRVVAVELDLRREAAGRDEKKWGR